MATSRENWRMKVWRNKHLTHKLREIYKENNFPLDYCIACQEVIDKYDWSQIDAQDKQQTDCVMQEFVNCLDRLIASTKQGEHDHIFYQCTYIRMKEDILKRYAEDPSSLISGLKLAIKQEEQLMTEHEEEGYRYLEENEPEEVKPQVINELTPAISKLNELLNQCKQCLQTEERKQQEFLVKLENWQVQENSINERLQVPINGENIREALLREKGEIENDKNKESGAIYTGREKMMEQYQKIVQDLEAAEKTMKAGVDDWKTKQKLNHTGLTTIPENALAHLNTLCGHCGELVVEAHQQIWKFRHVCQQLNFHGDPHKDKPEALWKQVDKLLEKHILSVVVIEKQPQPILKVEKMKSKPFPLSVKILGGRSLSLNTNPPTISVIVRSEEQMKQRDYVTKICSVMHFGDEPRMEYDKATDMVGIHVGSVELKDVRKSAKATRDETVTDYLYGMAFTIELTVSNKKCKFKVHSLPFVIISQTSQYAAALPVILWYMAFSELESTPYEVCEQRPWGDVARLLNAYFEKNTGRGLSEPQLRYLGRRAMDIKDCPDIFSIDISRNQLYRKKMHQKDFSFWRWFYACMNLFKDYLKKEWEAGLIHGFMSKQEANTLLIDKQIGTFLLRPSESEIPDTQSQNISGCLTLAVVEYDPCTLQKRVFHVKEHLKARDLHKRGLASTLENMEVKRHDNPQSKKRLLERLCENPWTKKKEQLFYEAFRSFLVNKDEDEDKSGYNKAKITIEIFLGDGSHNLGPGSPMSAITSPGSVATPDVQVFSPEISEPESELPPEFGSGTSLNIGSDDIIKLGLELEDQYRTKDLTAAFGASLNFTPEVPVPHVTGCGQAVMCPQDSIPFGQLPMPELPVVSLMQTGDSSENIMNNLSALQHHR